MKHVNILVIACVLSTSLQAQSILDKRISLPADYLTVAELIEEMRQQTAITISYGTTIPLTEKINVGTTSPTVFEVLKKIEQKTGIGYKVAGNKIILTLPLRRYTLSGYIRDSQSGESLIGASVYATPAHAGVVTNSYGYYSLTLPEDSLNLAFSYVGYQPVKISFSLRRDTVMSIHLEPKILEEVVVHASERESIQDLGQMSSFDISVGELEALPALVGETDIMKSMQLLPGVRAGDEGTSGMYVRGGGPDQNLILLDGVPVYNISHLFGFFSVFNADAINHIELVKGGFPARYGGRLSSVVDIRMKEGNNKEIEGEGSLGLIASKLTIEGPLIKDKASFIFSGRRTLLFGPFLKIASGSDLGYYFYDINSKLNYVVSPKSRIYLSVYSGRDKGYGDSDFSRQGTSQTVREKAFVGLGWGNLTTALRWNLVISPKLFSNITATLSHYNFKIQSENETIISGSNGIDYHSGINNLYSSGIMDYALKSDFDFIPSPDHYLRFGGYGTHHTFKPGATTYRSSVNDAIQLDNGDIEAVEFGGYVEDEFEAASRIRVNGGVHAAGFNVNGKTFFSLQPRLSVRYLVSEKFSIKSSYSNMTQFIHLLTNSGVGLPTDLWVPTTPRIKPQKSDQWAAGIAYKPEDNYELTWEGYYKTMDGVLEYKEGASYLNTSDDWQTKVEIGKGESYGSEIFLHKKAGAWKGWLGYTLSWTYREFDNINNGKKFPYRYDRRHDVELTVSHSPDKRVEFSGTWVYGTGNAITLPTAVYRSMNDITENLYYEGRNSYRLKPYHRMDLSVSFKKTKKWGERAWIISVYNVYSRRNAFYVDYGHDYTERNGPGNKLLQYSLFPIIPSITYNFKF